MYILRCGPEFFVFTSGEGTGKGQAEGGASVAGVRIVCVCVFESVADLAVLCVRVCVCVL